MPVNPTSIEEFREDVQKCMRCGFCVALCPVQEYMGFESNSPRGRMQNIKALIDKEIQVNDYLMNRIYDCTLCGYCLWRCPPGVRTVDAIMAARAHFVENRCHPGIHLDFAEGIKKYNNPYAEEPQKRFAWVPQSLDLPKSADVLYFVGCTSAFRLPEVAVSSIVLLSAAGIDFTIISDEACCGSVLLRTGMRELGKQMVEKNIQMIEEVGASTIVFSCPGCYKTLADDYPKLMKTSLGYELKHVSEYLLEIDELKLARPVNATVTYHDPCHLGRHLGIFEPPRELVSQIPGVKLVEMERNRNTATCCGAGAGVRGAFPEISLKIAKKRVREALAAGARTISSACPFCKRNLGDAVAEMGEAVQMYDIVQLAAKSVEVGGKQGKRLRGRWLC